MSKSINVFVIYAREDKDIKLRLLKHLNPLKDTFNLNIWHDDFIEAGQEWKPHIESRLEQTDVFLLLISADFMNSEFIHQVEFKFAIDRHKQSKSVVIPVIINYCLWDIEVNFADYTFNLNELQVLPDEGKPIDDWRTPEQAYNVIAIGIRKVLNSIKIQQQQQTNEQNKKNDAKSNYQQKGVETKQELVNSKEEKHKIKDKTLQSPIVDQEVITPKFEYEKPAYRFGTKKIIYSLLAVCVVTIVGYFILHKPANQASDLGHELKDTTTITHRPSGLDSSSSSNTTTSAVVHNFDNFSQALSFVIDNARNNFSDLRSKFVTTEDGMKKYRTNLVLYNFQTSYIFQNDKESKFVFTSRNNADREFIKGLVEKVLEEKYIKFNHDQSASMAFSQYTWNNNKYEIYLSQRKYTDNFIEVDIYHRR